MTEALRHRLSAVDQKRPSKSERPGRAARRHIAREAAHSASHRLPFLPQMPLDLSTCRPLFLGGSASHLFRGDAAPAQQAVSFPDFKLVVWTAAAIPPRRSRDNSAAEGAPVVQPAAGIEREGKRAMTTPLFKISTIVFWATTEILLVHCSAGERRFTKRPCGRLPFRPGRSPAASGHPAATDTDASATDSSAEGVTGDRSPVRTRFTKWARDFPPAAEQAHGFVHPAASLCQRRFPARPGSSRCACGRRRGGRALRTQKSRRRLQSRPLHGKAHRALLLHLSGRTVPSKPCKAGADAPNKLLMRSKARAPNSGMVPAWRV